MQIDRIEFCSKYVKCRFNDPSKVSVCDKPKRGEVIYDCQYVCISPLSTVCKAKIYAFIHEDSMT